MNEIAGLVELQIMMFLLMGVGIVVRKKELITDQGKRDLTNLLIYVILPCNIINSFRIEITSSIMWGFLKVFIIAIFIQIGCLLLSRILYNWTSRDHKAILQYGTICSNAGFLGNPIVEGIYGAKGLVYASIYLIPQRIVMWSAGISCFTNTVGRGVVMKILKHPCIIAVEIGLAVMFLPIPIPDFLSQTVKSIGGCTTAVSMILIGVILSDVNIFTVMSKMSLYYAIIRLILIPAIVLGGCLLFGVDSLVTGVSVVLAGMPAGSTTAILAAQFNGDAIFASKCVVLTTVLSMVTIPLWCSFMTFLV